MSRKIKNGVIFTAVSGLFAGCITWMASGSLLGAVQFGGIMAVFALALYLCAEL